MVGVADLLAGSSVSLLDSLAVEVVVAEVAG